MTDRQLSSEELVADYVRSSMRVESPDGLTDEVMRAVAAIRQARRTWFSASRMVARMPIGDRIAGAFLHRGSDELWNELPAPGC